MNLTDGASSNRAPDISIQLAGRWPWLGPGAAAWLAEHLRKAVAALERGGRVHLQVVDDAAMDRYHRQHSGVPGTTDVLTFPNGSGPALDVDIIACADEAYRQSTERGHAPERELLLYAVHGVLHCLGHDDHDPEAYARMHAEEDRILAAIGVGSTFDRPAGGDA